MTLEFGPHIRHQRLRKTPSTRAMLRETTLNADHLIQPIFIHETLKKPKPIATLPGMSQYPVADAVKEAEACFKAGLHAVLLFGIPEKKDEAGSAAWDPNGGVQQVIRAIKKRVPELVVMADCCLCEYTTHGHCGVLTDDGGLDNDETLDGLAKTAVSYAEAGADWVAPSGMMDGMVAAIRHVLDTHGYPLTAILSYAVKYASAFYGPFRDAAGSDAFCGERTHHQMQPSQRKEAIAEAEQDALEGADVIMVKPALAYLDIIRDLADRLTIPIAAYHVSGTYSMTKLAAKAGLIDEAAAFHEQLMGIKRAGAQLIISYYAKEFALKTAHARSK